MRDDLESIDIEVYYKQNMSTTCSNSNRRINLILKGVNRNAYVK